MTAKAKTPKPDGLAPPAPEPPGSPDRYTYTARYDEAMREVEVRSETTVTVADEKDWRVIEPKDTCLRVFGLTFGPSVRSLLDLPPLPLPPGYAVYVEREGCLYVMSNTARWNRYDIKADPNCSGVRAKKPEPEQPAEPIEPSPFMKDLLEMEYSDVQHG